MLAELKKEPKCWVGNQETFGTWKGKRNIVEEGDQCHHQFSAGDVKGLTRAMGKKKPFSR